jgi:molybdopterin/thiamine biosynthesis adenylyltransferase
VTDEPRIGVLGLGALGWPTAQSLVRLGYRALDLVDMDTVEPHNVGVIFDTTAVGRAKVEVAQQQLKAIDPEAEPAAWHGDLVHDLPLSVIAGWDAAVMALDRNSAKIPATQYLELLGVPYVQGQIDGASATALVRTYVPGQTCCLICLLSPQEMEFEVEFSCLRRRTDHGTGRPRLFTTAIEAQLGAALIAWRIRELVPPVPRSSPGPDAATSASDESGPEGARREGSLAAVVG